MDDELFELCRLVFGATDWKPVPYSDWHEVLTDDGVGIVPNYTSDFLLEKLKGLSDNAELYDDGALWSAHLRENYVEAQKADTPLKALLKLTLALNEAGILTKDTHNE